MNPRRCGATALALASVVAHAQEATERVTVTATRVPEAAFAVPAAIDAVDAAAIREDNLLVNLSESLSRVPGLVVLNRQNYAQDLQISSRGFGSRSTFGVRGVRLIADGIPTTMPDGQGQAASFDLGSADRIEVLRGASASLYGNSSGGVVQIFTADGPPVPTIDVGLSAGSFGQWRLGARFGGQAEELNYSGSASRYETDGYRDHSAARRDQANVKLRYPVGPGTLTLVANALDQPDSQDPLGLTRAEFEANPRGVDPAALLFNTRKSVHQSQAGFVYDIRPSQQDSAQARVYYGTRTVLQFLPQTGDTPLGSGGVVDLDRWYAGVGLRFTHEFQQGVVATVGFDYDELDEHRRGFVNNFGAAGALRRDEDDVVRNSDLYAQAEWTPSPDWTLSAGVRRSSVPFDSHDHYIVGPNPDDSGSVSYSHTTPVVGVLFKLDAAWHLYANAGEGFETPTTAELAYRPGGATGLNFALEPSTSRHYEAGLKVRPSTNVSVNLAAFHIETRNEIVVDTNVGGRTTYKNAPSTTRNGLEAFAEGRFAGGFEATFSYTALDARFTEGFTEGTPPVAIAAGNHLPSVPSSLLFAQCVWRDAATGFHAGIEVRHSSQLFVNDANTDAASAYTVVNLRAGLQQDRAGWSAREFVRIDNVADRRYAGSVIVAESQGRYFETAPGRAYLVGLELSF